MRNLDNSQQCQNMDKEKERAQKELNECEEANDILQYKLAEIRVLYNYIIQRSENEYKSKLEMLQKENEALVLPQLQNIKNEIKSLIVFLI